MKTSTEEVRMTAAGCCHPSMALFKTMAVLAAYLTGFGPGIARADATKTGSGTDLTGAAAGVWSGGAGPNGSPTGADLAIWNSSSQGAGLTLDSGASWKGISVLGALTDIQISGAGTLTLGAGGIDLSASSVNLSIANNVSFGANQVWVVNAGKVLTNSGVISGAYGLSFSGQSYNYGSYLPASPTTNLLFSGVSLTAVTGAIGTINGGWITGGPCRPPPTFLPTTGRRRLTNCNFMTGLIRRWRRSS